ncbi:von Willebrand factor D and EGF domain-containing protein-like [Babylonia areolata]|uniref:von Willebrand factor D and EGF domain-containing protein-like n=1 Tax=Babylonia areolata TaxID=304850 RepID=UPI003FD04C30
MMRLLCLAVILLASFLCTDGGSVQDAVREKLTQLEDSQMTMQIMLENLDRRQAQDFHNLTQCYQGIQDTMEEQRLMLQNIQQTLRECQEPQEPQEELTGPCRDGEYKVLNESWRSITNNVGKQHSGYKCDSSLEDGWYRFFLDGENAVIPTTCVQDHHCNTHAPQWVDLQGQSLPSPGEQVDVRACANWDNDCCNWESPITVRNCGRFYVYRLQPRSTCKLAYCTEPQS